MRSQVAQTSLHPRQVQHKSALRPGSVVQTQLPRVLQPRGSAGTAAAGGAPGPALWAEMGQQRYSPAKGTAQGLLSCASENRSFSCHVFPS